MKLLPAGARTTRSDNVWKVELLISFGIGGRITERSALNIQNCQFQVFSEIDAKMGKVSSISQR